MRLLPLLLRHQPSSPRNLEEYLLLFSLCCFLLGSIPNILEWWSGDTSWVLKQRDLIAKRMAEAPAGGGRGAGVGGAGAATAAANAASASRAPLSEGIGQEAASEFVIVPSPSSTSSLLEDSKRHHHQQNVSSSSSSSSSSLFHSSPPSPSPALHLPRPEEYEKVTFDDIVVTIITSSATMDRRLPLLYEAWIKDAPFPVVILTDSLNGSSNYSFTFAPYVQVRGSDCAAAKNGLICKTKRAFQLMHQEFGGGQDGSSSSSSGGGGGGNEENRRGKKKWFLRLMDDTLVILDNLLHLLNQVDASQSLCVGDLIPLANVSFAFFQGGAGWGLTGTALDVVSQHWQLWDDIVLSGGNSPVSPGFMALSSFADDLFWGIFISNFAAATAAATVDVNKDKREQETAGGKHIHMVSLPGWSGAPIDVKAGVVPCHAELQRDFCIQQVFPVGSLYWSAASSSQNHQQQQPHEPQEVSSIGSCRNKMTKVGIVHMGLEVVGGRGGENAWVEQIVNVSRVFSSQQQQQQPQQQHSSSSLVANFEDGPLYYWRLCRLMDDNHDDNNDNKKKETRQQKPLEAIDPPVLLQTQQQLRMAIYNATTLTKMRLSEEVFHQGRMHRISIGLCQEPEQVVRQLLLSSSKATAEEQEPGFLLLQALTRLRDHLRFHLRPSAFSLQASGGGGKQQQQQQEQESDSKPGVAPSVSVQVVYRVGENATALAEVVCVRLKMAGHRKCLDYAVTNMQRDLPWYLHYDHLCRRSGASVIEANQLQDM